jgi:5-formyltetrahydrofolate cyclo-ligase
MASDNPIKPNKYASPPCLGHEIDPTFFESGASDPQQALDVARWRKAERSRLLEERTALPIASRQIAATDIVKHLDKCLVDQFGSIAGMIISAWWPIKAELDLRFWLERLGERGARAALPVVMERASPLAFRIWTRGTKMKRGFWNIPVPAEGPEIIPDITLSPVVGWDNSGYRLGYGGGYFDRTLAALCPQPFSIGVGLNIARIASIFPQPHDIPMTVIITETGIHSKNS